MAAAPSPSHGLVNGKDYQLKIGTSFQPNKAQGSYHLMRCKYFIMTNVCDSLRRFVLSAIVTLLLYLLRKGLLAYKWHQLLCFKCTGIKKKVSIVSQCVLFSESAFTGHKYLGIFSKYLF